MTTNFLGKKLLFIVAHPDDESFAASGTIFKNRQMGGENYIICATLGEKGKSHMTSPVTQNQLAVIRKKELTAAAKFLKVKGLFFFNFPDTKLDSSVKPLQKKTDDLVKKIQPDYIFSFGPDGMSGHLDHITIGSVAKKSAEKNEIPFLAFGASPALRKNFKLIMSRRKHGKYAVNIKHKIPNLKVKVDLKEKQKTLKFHKSQFGQSTLLANMPKNIKKGFMTYEYFVG